jgi:hypothetical protein
VVVRVNSAAVRQGSILLLAAVAFTDGTQYAAHVWALY